MKSSVLALTILASAVNADSPGTDKLPKCTQKCLQPFVSGGGDIAGCKQLDIGCVCKNDDFISSIACCLEKECDKDSQNAALQYAKTICATAKVDTPDKIDGVCKENKSSDSKSDDSKSDDSKSDDSKSDDSKSDDSKSGDSKSTDDKSDDKGKSGAGALSAVGGAIAGLAAMIMAL